eukprot:4800570-Lingulodinium_polyedra.AAC.1
MERTHVLASVRSMHTNHLAWIHERLAAMKPPAERLAQFQRAADAALAARDAAAGCVRRQAEA